MNNRRNIKRQLHPRQEANITSILTYFWTIPTFSKGMKKDLEEEDLFKPLEDHASNTLGDKLEEAWRKELQFYKNPSLWRALGRVFGIELILFGFVFVFSELVLKMAQPLALSKLLSFYARRSVTYESEGFLYASIIVGSSLGNALLAHWYSLSLQHFGMKVRVACCSLVYRKSLKLSKNAIGETTIGQMVNLLSNDVNRFDKAAVHLHSLWFVPIETGIIVYILYRIVGLTSAIGVLFLALFVPLQVYLGKKIANFRLTTALKTDERIQLMNEIISGIQVIKMYTWEKQFTKLVAFVRKLEIKKIRGASYVRGILLSFSIFTTRIAIFLIVIVYVLHGHTLKAEYVFVATSFYNILRQAITKYYPQGITQIGEASVSISRLKKFLLCEEILAETQKSVNNTQKNEINGNLGTNSANGKISKDLLEEEQISLKNVTAKWSSNSSQNTLDNINITIETSGLVAITGPVGSGKTSFLHAILKELPLENGIVSVKGNISYASQEPWIFSGTIRENILFGQPFNFSRYKKVLEVCALDQDLSLFLYGDENLVGERGVTLSGGQRARVNLARAIYRDADIYLLDDPLSAVDAHVGKKIFEDCILDFLEHKCTILVTHQVQYLKNLNRIIVMESGRIITCGTYQELNQMGIELSDHRNQDKSSDMHNDVETTCENFTKNVTKQNGIPFEVKELRSSGKISNDVYSSYFKAGGSLLVTFLVLSLFLLTQVFASAADYFVAYWVNLEKDRSEGKKDLYLGQETCIYIYVVIISFLIIITLSRSIFFFKYCMKASTKLHNKMFSNIIHVSMNFFNANSSGRILNRFAKDMGSIDETLPSVIMDCIQIGFTVIGLSVVVAIVNPWLLVITGTILTIFYSLKIVYLTTSRSLKRLEGITRSPVFTHMNASLQGLTTVRALRAQKFLQREFDEHQDLHSSAWYLFLSCSTAFGFWLDIICVTYIAVVTFSFLIMKNEQYVGNVGLAITQAINLSGMFQWGMRQWSDLENQMTAVERVTEYTKIEQEPDRNDIIPVSSWPQNGNIVFSSVSLRYSPTDTYVLKQLNINIKSKEKIGIVGRTGAGKSSLVHALFQLTQTEGEILIDNVDITKIPLHTLRSKISIIPQEPVLFSGTLRNNLDPLNEYTDVDLWRALEEVELKNIISSLPSGLEERISEGGSNFSVGQKQLICLVRAVIRNNKILVLDEATANLDAKTDSLIQETIRKKFAECTVLTIAHRLHTIMDSDKVLVMHAGNAVEFEHPQVLLKNEKSLFYAMVQQTENSSSSLLMKAAEKSYEMKMTKN